MNSLLGSRPPCLQSAGRTPTGSRSVQRFGAEPPRPSLDAADVDEARATLAARDDVGCVVALDGDEAAFLDLDAAVTTVSEHLPILAYVDEDPTVATAVARTGRRFLPRSADDDALQDALDDALETYEERRQAAADSAMFRTLLDEGGPRCSPRTTRRDTSGWRTSPTRRTRTKSAGRRTSRCSTTTRRSLKRRPTTTWKSWRRASPSGAKRENFSQRGGEYWSESTKIPWRDSDGDVQAWSGSR